MSYGTVGDQVGNIGRVGYITKYNCNIQQYKFCKYILLYITKLTILIILSVQFNGIKYIQTVVQP
jgi:hypothetical protein